MPLPSLLSRLQRLWRHDIWAAGLIRDPSLKGRFLALLRVCSISVSGLHELHVAIRAAALSYSSLLALGPLIAIAVLISGFAIGNRDPALVAQGLNSVISFIAPQVAQYDKVTEAERATDAKKHPAPAQAADPAVATPEMVQLLNNFIVSSRSGTAGDRKSVV